MKRLFTLIILLSFSLLSYAQDYRYSRVKIEASQTNISSLLNAGIPADAGFYDKKNNTYTAELSQDEIRRLADINITYEILVDDVSQWYIERNAIENPHDILLKQSMAPSDYPVPANFTLGSCGGFLTIDQCYSHLDNMATLFPNLITARAPISDLKTYENRDVFYVKISKNPNTSQGKPQVLYTGMHHAREPIGMQHLIYFMYYLLENYDTNQEVRDLVDNTELYFIPIVNVDGYNRNITNSPNGGGMWRKNVINNGDGSTGVDLNRNYGYNWGYDNQGSSPSGSSETYRGTAPFSEQETKMLKSFCETHNFKIALNYHSYSNLLLYPWGYAAVLTPDEAVFAEYSKNMTRDNNYTYGPGSTTIYPSNGGSDDWMYGEQTTKEKILSYTPEVGSDADGFWPQVSRIIPLCQENMIQSILAAKYSGVYGELSDLTPLIVPDYHTNISLQVKRLGQTQGTFTVSVSPLDDKIVAVGDPVNISGLGVLESENIDIPVTLSESVKSGDTIRYITRIYNGYSTTIDTVERYFGEPVVLFEDDLTNNSKWTGQWAITNSSFVSAPGSMTDSPVGNYGNNANKVTTLSEGISLTNASVAVLSYWARWDLEPSYDYAQVLISKNNGSTWLPLQTKYTKPGSAYQAIGQPLYDGSSTWVKEEINISNFANETIKLRFALVSDGGVTADGYYFDDVKISMIDRTVNTTDYTNKVSTLISDAYPNPSNGIVEFRSSLHIISSVKVSITDIQGRVVKSLKVNPTNSTFRINLDDLNAGIYFCNVITDLYPVITKKIMIK